MGLQFLDGSWYRYANTDERPTFARPATFYRSPDERRSLAHRHDAEAAPRCGGGHAPAVILDIQLEKVRGHPKAHPSVGRPRIARPPCPPLPPPHAARETTPH